MAKAFTQGARFHSAPRWAGDFFTPDRLLPGGAKLDASLFASAEADVVVDVGAAGAAVGATSVPVTALSGPIPNNTRLDFGTKGIVVLTAEAATGAVALTVEPLVTALVDADVATYGGTELNGVSSGILLGRTYAERDAGTGFGPAADADDEFYLLAFDVPDVDNDNDCDLYRHGGVVKENYLPKFASLSAAQKAKIRALYECTIGKD